MQARTKVAGQILGVLDKVCITSGTLAAFCVGQGIFWILVGSKQFENVVKDKVEISRMFLDNESNQSLKVAFCHQLNSLVANDSLERMKRIEEENIEMMKQKFKMFFNVTFCTFCITLILVFYKYRNRISELSAQRDVKTISEVKAQRKGFIIGLFLVFFSFSTEIFIFNYIIQPYIIIGDLEIVNKIV